jgi:ABC-type lipoprotein release transport system permease subunit
MGAVAVGIWALLFLLSFSQGFVATYIEDTIENQTSHLQIHNKEFQKDKEVKYFIDDSDKLMSSLANNDQIKKTTIRSLANGMIATAKGARGISIRGINPSDEAAVTKLDKKIIEGKYLMEEGRNPIIIGRTLAEKLKTKLRKKVVLTFTDATGEQIQASFRIVGIYSMGNSQVDQAFAYVRQSDLNRLLGVESGGHEIAMLINDIDNLDAVTADLQSKNDTSTLAIENYKELSPSLSLYSEQMSMSTGIMTFIIMFALIFGIINTMLMAVLERTKELGMLMAIGMNKRRVFSTIVVETIMLSLIGAPLGLLLGWLTITITGNTGIDLSMYSEGMDMFQMGSGMVYPTLEGGVYIFVAIAVFFTALIASIFPARRAIKLKPVEALRKI